MTDGTRRNDVIDLDVVCDIAIVDEHGREIDLGQEPPSLVDAKAGDTLSQRTFETYIKESTGGGET